MDASTGELYSSAEEARDAGVPIDRVVEIRGEEEHIRRISQAIKDQRRMKKKAAKASRKKNRK